MNESLEGDYAAVCCSLASGGSAFYITANRHMKSVETVISIRPKAFIVNAIKPAVQTIAGMVVSNAIKSPPRADLEEEHRQNDYWFIHKGSEVTKESVGEC